MLPRGVALGGGHRPPLRPRGAADLRPCEVQTWGSSPPKFLGRSIHSSLPFFFLFFTSSSLRCHFPRVLLKLPCIYKPVRVYVPPGAHV